MVPEDLPEGAASSAPEPTAERNPEAEAEVAESTEVAVVLDLVLGRIVLKVRPRRTLPSRFLEGEGPPSAPQARSLNSKSHRGSTPCRFLIRLRLRSRRFLPRRFSKSLQWAKSSKWAKVQALSEPGAWLSRPDIIKPINDLATKARSWSRGDDKQLLRLIQYIDSTPHYRLV